MERGEPKGYGGRMASARVVSIQSPLIECRDWRIHRTEVPWLFG